MVDVEVEVEAVAEVEDALLTVLLAFFFGWNSSATECFCFGGIVKMPRYG